MIGRDWITFYDLFYNAYKVHHDRIDNIKNLSWWQSIIEALKLEKLNYKVMKKTYKILQ